MTDTLLIEFLSQFMLERRLSLIYKVLENRTRYFTVVLEDIVQSQNASAVMRTCDCLGVQDIYIVENRNQYQYNPQVALGSGKWTNLVKFNQKEHNSLDAVMALKNKGYRIVATQPGENCTELKDFDITRGKTAFVFGSEINGISQVMRDNADELLTIPMYGFTESYNISVSAAMVLFTLTEKLRSSEVDWKLTTEEYNSLLLEWLKASLKKPELLIKKFYSLNK